MNRLSYQTLLKSTLISKFTGLLFSTILLTTTQTVNAHSGATGIVKERMNLMDNLKQGIKSLSSIYKGDTPYDAEIVRNTAKAITEHSGNSIIQLFPEGSAHAPSKAKANIWQQWNEFKSLSNQQLTLSNGLFDSAKNAPIETEYTVSKSAMMGSTSNMMGTESSDMMGITSNKTDKNLEDYSKLSSDVVFKKLIDNCSACHTKFRTED